jgi:DNA-binding FadR family transcriptional regulator
MRPVAAGVSRQPFPKLAHRVAAVLRRQIVRGEIAADVPLPSETELMAQFEVSRETVREALSVLQAESLIRVKRGRGGGPVARRPDLSSAARYLSLLMHTRGVRHAEIQEAKLLLERPAAGLAAGEPPRGALEELTLLHAAESAAVDAPLEFVDTVAAFDEAVVAASGNDALSIFAGILREAYLGELYVRCTTPQDPTAAAVVRSHGRFLDAMRRADADAGARVWSEYLNGRAGDACGPRLNVVPLWRARSARAAVSGNSRRTASVALEMRVRLATGDLRPGDRLAPVPELAGEFGVSLPTMREALRVLESEGLLSIRAGSRSGPKIGTPTVETATGLAAILLECAGITMGDVWEARTLIEPAIMGVAAQRVVRSDVAKMRGLLEEARAMVHDSSAFLRQQVLFRLSALHATRNDALAVIFEIIRWIGSGSLDAISETEYVRPWESRVHRRIVEVYGRLVDAYDAGDGDLAARVWADHLAVTVPLVRTNLADRFIADLHG